MTQEDLMRVLAIVRSNWNLRLTPNQEKDQYRTWGRYLMDLPDGPVMKAVDRLVLRGGPPPRAGDVRRLAIDINDPDGAIPGAIEAWSELQTMRDRVASGLSWQVPSPVLKYLLDKGHGLLGLSTNGDRDVFVRLYDKAWIEVGEGRYGI